MAVGFNVEGVNGERALVTGRAVHVTTGDKPVGVAPAPGLHLDAFGRWRTSTSHLLHDSTQNDDARPLIWATKTATGGTIGAHDADRASTTLSVDGTSGARALRQTRRRFKYRAGQSQLVVATWVLPTLAPDRVAVVLRSSVSGSAVDEVYEQASWNGNRFLGENGGPKLSTFCGQIGGMDLQWLGTGTVRFFLESEGQPIEVHAVHNVNKRSSVYMSTARLPVRYEVVEDGGRTYARVGYFDDENGVFWEFSWNGAVAVDLEQVCSMVVREGGDESPAVARSISTGLTAATLATAGTPYSVLAVRLATGYKRASLAEFSVQVMNLDTTPLFWQLCLLREGDIPVGMSTWAAAGNATMPSAGEYSVDVEDMTTPLGSALVLESGFVDPSQSAQRAASAQGTVDNLIGVWSDVDDASDVLVLVVTAASGTNNECYASLTFYEEY